MAKDISAYSTRQYGMTIIEITVIIVVLAVLITISVSATLFSLARANDSEKMSDITALASLLEAHHYTKGKYPLLTDIQTGSVKGVTPEMLSAPGQESANTLVASSTPTLQQYGYVTFDQSDTACSSGAQCGVRFKLYWQGDQDKAVHVVSSIK